MMPGNILKRAMALTGNTQIALYAATGSVVNEVGLKVTTFADAQMIAASVQPVPQGMMAFLGLDAKRDYIMIYASDLIADVKRDTSGDQIGYNNDRYQVLNNTDWHPINGWNGTMAVKILPQNE